MRVLTWNLEWATASSWRAAPIVERLQVEAADVAVLTEAQLPMARSLYEHVIDAGPHPRARQPVGSKVIVAILTMTRGTRLERDLAGHLSASGLRVVTSGDWEQLTDEPPLIDHVALSRRLCASDLRVWGRHVDGDQRRISDHAGVALTVSPQP